MSDVIRIVDSIKTLAGKEDRANGTRITTGTALTYGATKVKLDGSGLIIDGKKLYRSCTVKNLESGYKVIVAVTDGGQAYYVIDRLL